MSVNFQTTNSASSLKVRARAELELRRRHAAKNSRYDAYRSDPVLYAKRELGVDWWVKQIEVAESVVNNPKTFVKACHSVGKTHLAGGLVSWHYDCFNPSITKTTAPTKVQVVDLTWKEVRLQRRGRNMLPKAARIESFLQNGDFDPAHFAAGYTAKDANSFQGDHEEHLLIMFEEAVGIEEQFWTAAEGMLSSGPGNRWLAIMNPTDTSSHAYQEELSGDWNVINISALEHPNLAAELRGLSKPFPKAISLSWVEERVRKWCTLIQESEKKASDFCWPPLDYCLEKGIGPKWYRPGPLFEGKVLGRWPSQSTDSVWSEAMWLSAIEEKPDLQRKSEAVLPEIGCDVARFGDDNTTIHVRRSCVSIHHESHNGMSTSQTAGRLKQIVDEVANQANCEKNQIVVKVDDDGVGGGVIDQRGAYNFVGLSAGSRALEEDKYPNRRSEFWFSTAARADDNRLDFSHLSPEALTDLRRQFMAPKWKLDNQGRRVVEKKEDTKKRIKRSPDDADAVNLAYAPTGIELPTIGPISITQKSSWRV